LITESKTDTPFVKPKFHYHINKNLLLGTALRKLNSFQNVMFHFLKSISQNSHVLVSCFIKVSPVQQALPPPAVWTYWYCK